MTERVIGGLLMQLVPFRDVPVMAEFRRDSQHCDPYPLHDAVNLYQKLPPGPASPYGRDKDGCNRCGLKPGYVYNVRDVRTHMAFHICPDEPVWYAAQPVLF